MKLLLVKKPGFFCLGAVVTIKVRVNVPPVKIFHESELLEYQDMSSTVPEN